MASPVLLSNRPRSTQVVLAAVVPFAFGAVVGVALGISAALYWALSALAALGAVLAGMEHASNAGAVRRGLLGGVLFAAGILIVHVLTGADEKVSLGSFPPFLIVIDAAAGALLGVLGARLRARRSA
jgi:hypothetical protein